MPLRIPKISAETVWKPIRKHLNFYRIHLLFFSITPLIFSGIFYASNGRFHISYIDSLYNSVSAMTVCGLATVNLSSLTGWQQTILFIQMCLGSPVTVSWVMVYIRRYYFAKKFDHIIATELASRAANKLVANDEAAVRPWPRRFTTFFRDRTALSTVIENTEEEKDKDGNKDRKIGIPPKLRPDMIRRMDDAPKLVDPSGWISEGQPAQMTSVPSAQSGRQIAFEDEKPSPKPLYQVLENDSPERVQDISRPVHPSLTRVRRLSDPGTSTRSSSASVVNPIHIYETVNEGFRKRGSFGLNPAATVEFAPNDARRENVIRGRRERSEVFELDPSRVAPDLVQPEDQRSTRDRRSSLMPQVTLTQHTTTHSHRPVQVSKTTGFGGFPTPFEILGSLFQRFFPGLQNKLVRTVTIPATTTITSHRGTNVDTDGSKVVPYISFDAVVGRNSAFHLLTNEQLEELGGVEYRALNALLYIVAGYHIGVQLLAFTVIAPYMSLNKWKEDFEIPMQFRNIPSTWFSLFQAVSAYTNTGMSLVDQSMVPFQTAYPMIVFMILLILAGNTAFPIFLRFTIWIISKLVPKNSRINETLHFLLDHPRRCFIYLFPSHQTWFLLTILISLNFTDWFFFMVLDIGNPAIDYIPLGVRFVIGLLQAVAVRAAGFGTVALSALAPAVKVLYVVMMYISVYPIALSVRSTNVYEEQSLGIFRDDDESIEEHEFEPAGSRVAVWSRYLAMHARRQLAFDMWWLGLALFLVCIIERGGLDNPSNYGWFNIFTIIFELVSAYGTVGLSLGIPTENYSFSGALRPLSKLIICFVMLRGRHRGLPVAIDRAVLLPAEFQKPDDRYDNQKCSLSLGQPSRPRDQTPGSSDASNEKRRSSEDSTAYRRRLAKRDSQELYIDKARRRSYFEENAMNS